MSCSKTLFVKMIKFFNAVTVIVARKTYYFIGDEEP